MTSVRHNKIFIKGFTLIELLIVIAIIGILASVVLVSMASSRKEAETAKYKSVLTQASKAIAMCCLPNKTATIGGITGLTEVCTPSIDTTWNKIPLYKYGVWEGITQCGAVEPSIVFRAYTGDLADPSNPVIKTSCGYNGTIPTSGFNGVYKITGLGVFWDKAGTYQPGFPPGC